LIAKITAVVEETGEFEKRDEPIILSFLKKRTIKNLKRGSKSRKLPPKFSHEVVILVRTLLKESKPVITESFEFESRDESVVNGFVSLHEKQNCIAKDTENVSSKFFHLNSEKLLVRSWGTNVKCWY